MAAKFRPGPGPSQPSAADCGQDGGQQAAQPCQCEIKSNLIKLLKEKCGEEMKSGTNSGNAGLAPAGLNVGGAKLGQKSKRTAEK
jgi:hypothetical protein